VLDLPEPDELSEAALEPQQSNWWERITSPSSLVLAARMIGEA
jgi:hypothetical protein